MKREELAACNAVLDLYESMLGEVHVPEVLRHAAVALQQSMECERATIYIALRDTQELESAAVVGHVSQRIRIPISRNSLAGFSALTQRFLLVQDAYGDLSHLDPVVRFDRSWDRRNGFVTRDVMCAPAMFRGELQGVVQVMNSVGRPFGEDDRPALESMARLVANSLYHARMYDELETMKRLKQEKAQFMRVLVHELRAPAAMAKTLVATAKDLNEDPGYDFTFLDKIDVRMSKMLLMIEELLALSRIQEGGCLSEVGVLDLGEESRQTCLPYAEQAAGKGLDFSLELPDAPVVARFDRLGWGLVVSNLASNAVKYTESGSVRVSLEAPDGEALLRVSDTGMGIPHGDVPKLFREFFRASNARQSNIIGTGVGLTGAKELVERFGGRMELETEEGKGTTFLVRLPRHES